MTIAKSSGSQNKSTPRDAQNSASFDAQSVSGSSNASGWGPGVVAPPSASGWAPVGPPVPGPSSSPRWNGPAVPGTSGLGQVDGQNSKKRSAPPSVVVSQSPAGGFYGNFDELNDLDCLGGPSATKRSRHCAEVRPPSAGAIDPRSSPEPGTSGHDTGGDGYNSEDEYSHYGVKLSEEEWLEKDRRFERLMKKKGFVIKKMQEDGSCLFRAVADQIYGDQEMHEVVREHCMNYIEQNSDYYSQYITESVSDYVERKRFLGVHGNHLEIQALSEMYNRPIHIYCYSAEPINIFQANVNNEHGAAMRLCYHRCVHYNSIVDPTKATIGVGLGLPNYSPGSADKNLVGQAMKKSEEDAVEKAMLEDKIRATDWEATNEAIEEQVARESYLQWLRDNGRRNPGDRAAVAQRSSTSTATVTSGELRVDTSRGGNSSSAAATAAAHLASSAMAQNSPSRSPKPCCSSFRSSNSPRAGCSTERDSPKPSGSSSPNKQHKSGLKWSETASFLNGVPSYMFGVEDWSDADVLTQVLAASQQEYLDSLKKQNKSRSPSPPRSTPPPQDSESENFDAKSDKKLKSKKSR